MEQKMSWKRQYHLGMVVFSTVLLSILFAYKNGLMLDSVIVYLAIDAVFLFILLYLLENNRLEGRIGNNKSDSYRGISWCYVILCILCFVSCFFPAYTCPAAAFALFMSIVSNPEIAMSISIFLCVILCVADRSSFYELAAYCMLAFVGAQLAKTMHEKKYRIWGCLILYSVSVMMPLLFYYLEYAESSTQILVWNGILGAMAVLCYLFLAGGLYDRADYGEKYSVEKMIQEDYPLVLDIRNYSRAEYVHARKASKLAQKCAKEIGADEAMAAAAGFYYRLGILEGEPFIENGVKLAQENCFPEKIVRILSEYHAQEKLPSSRESAIVHMVDVCLNKDGTLSGHHPQASWNPDMTIYQTLNALSATGVYDESGLSMNQFLKIRELLVREEMSYDNHNGRGDAGNI